MEHEERSRTLFHSHPIGFFGSEAFASFFAFFASFFSFAACLASASASLSSLLFFAFFFFGFSSSCVCGKHTRGVRNGMQQCER